MDDGAQQYFSFSRAYFIEDSEAVATGLWGTLIPVRGFSCFVYSCTGYSRTAYFQPSDVVAKQNYATIAIARAANPHSPPA